VIEELDVVLLLVC